MDRIVAAVNYRDYLLVFTEHGKVIEVRVIDANNRVEVTLLHDMQNMLKQ